MSNRFGDVLMTFYIEYDNLINIATFFIIFGNGVFTVLVGPREKEMGK